MAWEVKRDSGTKFMFCYVSGGYVMVGTREKSNPFNTSSESCYVEEFSTHTGIQNAIRTVMIPPPFDFNSISRLSISCALHNITIIIILVALSIALLFVC